MEMTKNCKLLGEKKTKMLTQPYPGEIGKKIQQQYSKEAWLLWIEKQTQLINEEKLNPLDPSTNKQLVTAMIKFLKVEE